MRVEIMKICTKCKIEKELTEFSKNAACSDGKDRQCKNCKFYLSKCQTPPV